MNDSPKHTPQSMAKLRWKGKSPQERSVICRAAAKKRTSESYIIGAAKAAATREANKNLRWRPKTLKKYKESQPNKPRRASKTIHKMTGYSVLLYRRLYQGQWELIGKSVIDKKGKLAIIPLGLTEDQTKTCQSWISDGVMNGEQVKSGLGFKMMIQTR